MPTQNPVPPAIRTLTQAFIKSYRWYLGQYNEIKSKTSGVTHTVGWKQGILGFFKKFV